MGNGTLLAGIDQRGRILGLLRREPLLQEIFVNFQLPFPITSISKGGGSMGCGKKKKGGKK